MEMGGHTPFGIFPIHLFGLWLKCLIFARGNPMYPAMKYLDPKTDLTFKKVFGEHPDLIISLINAMLPFDPGQEVQAVEYLPPELVPETPLRKDTVVDVRCRDNRGRQFLVEMQMIWSSGFKQRVLFNAGKAYVRQLDKGDDFHLLQPVYSLNLVNEIFEPDLPDCWYHNYGMAHTLYPDHVIEGLHLIFVELPKFKPQNYSEKRMQVLWLRFLTEIGHDTRKAPDELLADPHVSRALEIVEESAFDEVQMYQYDKFWDIIRVERTYIREGELKGLAKGRVQGRAEGRVEGIAEGIAKGRAEGMAQGEAKRNLEIARSLKSLGQMEVATIAQITGLTKEEVEAL